MSVVRTFNEVMNCPDFKAQQEQQKREADVRHLACVQRNPAPMPMTRQERKRQMITGGREFHFEHAAHRSRSLSAPQQSGRISGKRGAQSGGNRGQ